MSKGGHHEKVMDHLFVFCCIFVDRMRADDKSRKRTVKRKRKWYSFDQNQLNKREKKEGPIEEVKYAKTTFQQEKKESLLALFDQMRSLGFEGDADKSEEDGEEKETLTDAEYHKRDQELLEHPESYGVCESDLDENIITYDYIIEGKTIQEAIANCQKTLGKLKAYGVEGADHLLDGLSTKEDDYVKGIWRKRGCDSTL